MQTFRVCESAATQTTKPMAQAYALWTDNRNRARPTPCVVLLCAVPGDRCLFWKQQRRYPASSLDGRPACLDEVIGRLVRTTGIPFVPGLKPGDDCA